MSLTNPKDVITEERLSEFYQGIFPYLGGMPEILANKFSRGDIYSDNETLAGVWRDGKPIYQRILQYPMPASGSSTTVNIKSVISDFDSLIYDEVFIYLENGSFSKAPLYNAALTSIGATYEAKYSVKATGGNQYILKNVDFSTTTNRGFYILLLYTKTTDSPIAIGVDTDYSTDEKIVGTWLDGKPIWQDTVSTGGNVPSGATLILRTAMASTGYDTILYTK